MIYKDIEDKFRSKYPRLDAFDYYTWLHQIFEKNPGKTDNEMLHIFWNLLND